MQLRAHLESVVVQSIQDELVIVNLENGIYYSLTGSAAVIFSVLDSGCSRDDLLVRLRDIYSLDMQNHTDSIDRFVQQLTAESLMVPGMGNCQLNPADFLKSGFTEPVLNKYEDLQELLLLDPIRAVPSLDKKSLESG